MNFRQKLPFITCIASALSLQATPTVTQYANPDSVAGTLVSYLTGGNVSVITTSPNQPHFIGAPNGIAYFTGASSTGIPLNSGLVLSTGNAGHAFNANSNIPDAPGPTGSGGNDDELTDFNTAGDADLDLLIDPTYATGDAAGLVFNFIPTGNQVSLQCFLASEENNEYVNRRYNDIFGVFIKYPGTSTWVPMNTPMIPDQTQPALTVNEINYARNSNLYWDNSPSVAPAPYGITYDGFTSLITFKIPVTSGQQYGMKLVIADTADGTVDTAVFLKQGSLVAGTPCDGTLDASFNPGSLGPNGVVRALQGIPGGKTIIAGGFSSYQGVAQGGICRINADGSLDTTFNSGGSGANGTIYAMAQQYSPGGNLILIGGAFTSYNGTVVNHLCRLNPDGTLDSGFAGSDASLVNGEVRALFVDESQNIYAGGSFLNIGLPLSLIGRTRYAEFSPSGTLFSGTPGFNATVNAIAVQPGDGKVIIGGDFTTMSGYTAKHIGRTQSSGAIDTAFSASYAGSIDDGTVYTLNVLPDGKILIGGSFSSLGGQSRNTMVRVNSDGSADSAWINNALSGKVYATLVQNDGQIWVGGTFASAPFGLQRLLSTGAKATGFQPGSGPSGNVYALGIFPDGLYPDNKLTLGGNFSAYSGITRKNLARICNQNLY